MPFARHCPVCGKDFEVRQRTAYLNFDSRACANRYRPVQQPLEERFWKHVDQSGDCWVWTASLNTSGYGQINVEKRPQLAHRVAWLLTFGSYPPSHLELDHTCHNRDLGCVGEVACRHRRCVRPEHLQAVARVVNTRRGRIGRRTACRHGHAYTPENTYVDPSGHRRCRICASH